MRVGKDKKKPLVTWEWKDSSMIAYHVCALLRYVPGTMMGLLRYKYYYVR